MTPVSMVSLPDWMPLDSIPAFGSLHHGVHVCCSVCSALRPPTIFCSFCRQSDPLNTHLVGFCMLSPLLSDLAVFPCRSMFRFTRSPEQTLPPKPQSPRSAVFTHFSDSALLRRISSRTPRFVYSETERRLRRRLREPDE